MRNITKKVTIILLIVCMVASILALAVACGGDKEPTEKKAILILPGIMGSNIIDSATGKPLWAPITKEPGTEGLKMFDMKFPDDLNTILDQPGIKALLDFDGKGGAYEWIDKMKINKDGKANYEHVSAQVIDDNGESLYPTCATYGTLEYYEKTYHFLKEKFGNEYDVRMFEYDWRLDNSVSAERLEKFINDHGYTDVTFVAHSMGGVLASTYLARSEENRAKVNKFFSLGAPFFGAHKAIRVPENPLSMIGDNADMESMLGTVKSLVNGINSSSKAFDKFYDMLMNFVYDLPTIYQLIPYEDMCAAYTEEYPEIKDLGIVRVDGVAIKTYDEFIAFLKARDFSNDRCVDKMIDWQREQYVKQADGTWIHASKLVDTKYFVGYNLDTELCVNYENGKMIDCTMSKYGDGTVPSYSASCGLPLTDKKVEKFDGISHGDLSYDDRCLNRIVELMAEA